MKSILRCRYCETELTDQNVQVKLLEENEAEAKYQVTHKCGGGWEEIHYKKFVDRRTRRLVKEPLLLSLYLDDKEIMEGVTTGINENGLGARVKWVSSEMAPEVLENKKVTLHFKKGNILPTDCQVLRLEKSRDERYDFFLALGFLNLLDSDKEYLNQVIEFVEKI